MNLADDLANIPQTAAMYAEIAGVLAGLAFAALLLYVDPRRIARSLQQAADDRGASRSDQDGVLILIFGSLASLIICAILYATLAGGEARSPNEFAGLFLYGPAFSLSVLTIFFATAAAAAHLEAVRAIAQFVVGVTGPALSMALMALAGFDVCSSGGANCSRAQPWAPGHPFGFGMLLAAAVLLTSLGYFLGSHRGGRGRLSDRVRRAASVVAYLTLGCAVLSGASAVLLDLEDNSFTVQQPWLQIVEGTNAAFLIAFALLSTHGLSAERIAANASGAASTGSEYGTDHDEIRAGGRA